MIDLGPMQDALATLTESLALIDEYSPQVPEPLRQLMQRGLIQAFEYNYTLAIVMITRHIRERSSLPEKRDLTDFEELIRAADERELLLSSFSKWKAFRHARNMTSHTYHREKADAVAAVAPDFEHEMQHLLARLKEKSTK